jgi:hypothetical protein
MGSARRRLVTVALSVLLVGVAIAVGLSMWLDQAIPSDADAAELHERLHEREREPQERERAAERRAQTRFELLRIADHLRDSLEAEQQDRVPGSH